MTAEIKAAIAAMQTKQQVRPIVWRNATGTFSHHRDANGEFVSENDARTDLRFCKEWAA